MFDQAIVLVWIILVGRLGVRSIRKLRILAAGGKERP